MIHLRGRKLMVLGGNPETASFVKHAESLGIHTVVVDPNPHAPAKALSRERYDLEVFDVDAVVALARRIEVDGVIVGVADILVAPYYAICSELGLPCYAVERSINAFSTKDAFNRTCMGSGVPTIPGGVISSDDRSYLDGVQAFPVVIKPVDSGAGVGMRVCTRAEDLSVAAEFALSNSRRGIALVEQLMDCDDMFAYYSIVAGKAYLSCTADRLTSKKQPGLSRVCIGAVYPSKHTARFIAEVNGAVVRMIEGLGITAGVLNIQFFVGNDTFYAYDPGFRLQGEAPHIPLAAINDLDHRTMLCSYALSGDVDEFDLVKKNDVYLRGYRVLTVWVILRQGTIGQVVGLDHLQQMEDVLAIQTRFKKGDVVTSDMIGTERQVLARIHIKGHSVLDLRNKLARLREMLLVQDGDGQDMVVEWINPDDIQ
jgi:formate-dependent phosphoribosylglycinamide formyltransferase (GAR transformylase)